MVSRVGDGMVCMVGMAFRLMMNLGEKMIGSMVIGVVVMVFHKDQTVVLMAWLVGIHCGVIKDHWKWRESISGVGWVPFWVWFGCKWGHASW